MYYRLILWIFAGILDLSLVCFKKINKQQSLHTILPIMTNFTPQTFKELWATTIQSH